MRWQPEEAFLTVTLPPGHHRTGLKRHVAHGTVRWTNLRGGSNHLHRAHPKAEIKLQKSRWPGKRGSSLTKCMLQPMSIIAFMQPRSAACLSSDRLTACLVDGLSLEVPKARLDGALGSLSWWGQAAQGRGWPGGAYSLQVPSIPSHSVILQLQHKAHLSKAAQLSRQVLVP